MAYAFHVHLSLLCPLSSSSRSDIAPIDPFVFNPPGGKTSSHGHQRPFRSFQRGPKGIRLFWAIRGAVVPVQKRG